MISSNRPGRHRAPGGHNPLTELRVLARESTQPALKGAAIIAAAGGLVATMAQPASATPALADTAPATAPAAVGPDSAATITSATSTNPLGTIGLAPAKAEKAEAKKAAPKPIVIKDVVVEKERAAKAAAAKRAAEKKAAAERKAAAAKKAAAERRAAQQAASRTSTRQSLTTSTYTSKAKTNTATTSRASSGTRSSYNWATPGQCTWGAQAQWYNATGSYLGGFTGNALTWGYGARNAGYSVGTAPRARSVVVFQPGVNGASRSAGHVAWVTAVNGNKVTILEMNGLAGPYRYNTRTVTHMGGMQYIYAP